MIHYNDIGLIIIFNLFLSFKNYNLYLDYNGNSHDKTID